MSAFIVSNVHISTLVDAAASGYGLSYYWKQPCQIRDEDRERLFALLLTENYASYNARYGRSDQPAETDRYTRLWRTVAPVQVLKAIACYEYQSCEHAGWADSEAAAICSALRRKAIAALDGYEEAAWEIAA